jgi:hypothetical protein
MLLYCAKYFITRAIVTVFDLAFGLLFLTGLGTLLTAGYQALRGRRSQALGLLKRCGLVAGIYLATVAAVSLATPRRFVPLGEKQCSDDWCISVTGSRREVTPQGPSLVVDFQLSSRARRAPQRERFVAVYLKDSAGARYAPVPRTGEVPFDTLLAPGASVLAPRAFAVPTGVAIDGVVIAREGAGRFPGCCIIGDEGSLLHKATTARLE